MKTFIKLFFLFVLISNISLSSSSSNNFFFKRFEGNIGKDSVIVYLTKIDSNLNYKVIFIKNDLVLTNCYDQVNYVKDSNWITKLSYQSLLKNDTIKNKSIILKGYLVKKDNFRGSFIDSNNSTNWQLVELMEKYPIGSNKISYIDYNKDYYSFNDLKYDIQIIHPVIKLKDSLLSFKINNSILNNFVKSYENSNTKYTSLDNFVNEYLIADFKSVEDDNYADDNPADDKNFADDDSFIEQDWHFNNYIEINSNENNILALSCKTSSYSGGVHGGNNINNFNINTKTGNLLTLDSILIPNFKHKLDSLGRIAFAKYVNIHLDSIDEEIKENYWFPNSKFELNSNFSINYNGLLFTFNEYEIASYADGFFEILIDFKDIKELIRNDSPLYELIYKK